MNTTAIPSLGGVVANKYRIDREIGRGGMGIVYAATDVTLGRTVALKLLISSDQYGGTRPPTAAAPQDTARFMREARATAALRGDHVAQVYEAGVTPQGVPFLAMELLHGEDLEHHVARRGPLPYPEACDLLIQACVALHEAHQLGIVHRDLKPQNFFVLPPRDATGPKLKVLDFGISKMTSEADLALTQTTMTMGSPRYMSPEQVRSSKYVDARADIWALGAVLFEALTGRPLFNESTASALHAQIIADHAVPLRHVRVDAPPDLEQVILRCVEKDPARRFSNTVELAQALAPFASAQGREVATRLLTTCGYPLPAPVTVNAAVPYSTGTPGYAPTGHPLTIGAVPASSKKSGSLAWLWILLAVFCFVCIAGAAISALFLGAAVQALPASSAPEYDEPPPSDPPEPPEEDPDPPPIPDPPTPPENATPPAKARPKTDPAAEKERQEVNDRAFDEFMANTILRAADSQGATAACSMHQHTVNNPRVPPRGAAVSASIEVCQRAGNQMTVDLIRNSQTRRANAKN